MLSEIIDNPIYITVIALLGAMIFISWVNNRYLSSFKLLLLYRWVKMSTYSISIAVMLTNIFPDKSIYTLILTGALIYILFETIFAWINVSIQNTSNINMFAGYKATDNAWSAQKRHILLKNQLEKQGFKKSASLKLSLIEQLNLYALTTAFDNIDKSIRLYITFIPYGKASTFMLTSIKSINDKGDKIVTQSSFVPDGLLQPKEYKLENYPLTSDPLKLLKSHNKRIKNEQLISISNAPIDDINQEMHNHIKYNIKKGILNANANQDGFYTADGKYRVWLEMLRMNYFPF